MQRMLNEASVSMFVLSWLMNTVKFMINKNHGFLKNWVVSSTCRSYRLYGKCFRKYSKWLLRAYPF